MGGGCDYSAFETDYPTFSDCYLYVANVPPGTQAAIYDIDTAYHCMPIAPEDQIYVCLHFDSSIHLDHNACFGSKSSHAMLAQCANTISAIYCFCRIQDLIKWVDDFFFFHYPSNNSSPWVYPYDTNTIDDIATDLGWPWASKKHCPFTSSFSYIGMTWDLDKKVFFSQKKKDCYLMKIINWNLSSSVTKKDVESVIGTLNHCSLLLIAACTHLPSLYEFAQ
jgi:hypothetical protein